MQYVPAEYWLDKPAWQRAYRTDWAEVVGMRVRRLRRAHNMSLATFAMNVVRPDRSRYSPSYYSRLERGWGNGPLNIYLAMAALLDVHPGRLLGVDDAERDVNAEEMTLIRVLRRENIAPDEALHRLLTTARGASDAPAPPDAEQRLIGERPSLDISPAVAPPIEPFKSPEERYDADWRELGDGDRDSG